MSDATVAFLLGIAVRSAFRQARSLRLSLFPESVCKLHAALH